MKRIFCNEDFKDNSLASCYDEVPLWSVPFGLKLLDSINYSKPVKALDIGCGTGFPVLELAQRFGSESHFTGIDNWHEGLERIKKKLLFYEIDNITLSHSGAERLPFDKETFDLIISNNGLNNVTSLKASLDECCRVLKPNGLLTFTANLPETFSLFYQTLITVLSESGMMQLISRVINHIGEKRKSEAEMSQMLTNSGFYVKTISKDNFSYKFSTGTSFFNHFLIRLYFLNAWKVLLPEEFQSEIFNSVVKKLDDYSVKNKGLVMQVPFALYQAEKRN